METIQHTAILKRTGTVLIVVGLLDVALMVYCILNRIEYASSFNVFAVIAGILLMRGSLRTASVVRWYSVFMFSAFAALLIAWPLMQPIDLTVTQLRLSPLLAIELLVFVAFAFPLLFWLYRELGKAPVLAAQVAAGRKVKNMRLPAAVGVGLVAATCVSLTIMVGSESASKARVIAEQQLGSTYRYHVTSLSIAWSNRGTLVSGSVTAWNDREVRDVPVKWEEH